MWECTMGKRIGRKWELLRVKKHVEVVENNGKNVRKNGGWKKKTDPSKSIAEARASSKEETGLPFNPKLFGTVREA